MDSQQCAVKAGSDESIFLQAAYLYPTLAISMGGSAPATAATTMPQAALARGPPP